MYVGKIQLDTQDKPLWFHLRGLSQTASGYGGKLATATMVHHLGRWRRLYVMQWSNSGTAFILVKGARVVVRDYPSD